MNDQRVREGSMPEGSTWVSDPVPQEPSLGYKRGI